MNFFVPDIGSLLILNQEWTFTLFNEYRNSTMFNLMIKRGEILNSNSKSNQVVTIPKKLVIKVDRIYIKKGLSQYSSITFSIPKPKNKSEKLAMPLNMDYYGVKFWVKLHECNGIDVESYHGNKETHDLFNLFYKQIEREIVEKFGVEKCTKMLGSISKLLGSGQNLTNLKTHLSFDQFLSTVLSRIKDDSFLSIFLRERIKSEIRDFKIKKII